jgi:hypothetical protein
MEINNIIGVFDAMIKNKSNWKYVKDKQKEEFSFIFNRYFSKRYTEQAAFMNLKGIDKVLVMDLWYKFMLTQPFPRWFWSKSDKVDKPKITEKELKMLVIKLKVKPDDINYLIDKHPEFIKDELDYYKKLEKQI